jgi:hypothetical protein
MFSKVLEDVRGVSAVLFHGDGAGRGGPSDEARRRYRQVRHAEERLRPLRETRAAGVYWLVRDELRRFEREIGPEAAGDGRTEVNAAG